MTTLLNCYDIYINDTKQINNLTGYILCKNGSGESFVVYIKPKTPKFIQLKFKRMEFENRKETFKQLHKTASFSVLLYSINSIIPLIKDAKTAFPKIQNFYFRENELKEVFARFWALNPKMFDFHYLKECKGDRCPYTRYLWGIKTKFPNPFSFFRDIFEYYIVNRVKNYSKDNPLIYTSVGSGNLLQCFFQLLKLKVAGFNKFICHFIDDSYEESIFVDYNLKKRGDVIDFETYGGRHVNLSQMYSIYEYFFQDEKTDSIEIYVWKSFEEYANECTKNEQFKCDILSIMDVEPIDLTLKQTDIKSSLNDGGTFFFHYRDTKTNELSILSTQFVNDEFEQNTLHIDFSDNLSLIPQKPPSKSLFKEYLEISLKATMNPLSIETKGIKYTFHKRQINFERWEI